MNNTYNNKEKVYFLGAGFSKALYDKMPLMKELTEKLKNDISLQESISRLKLTNIEDNFEEMISYLYSDYPWKTVPENLELKSLYYKIIEKLFKIFSEIENEFHQDIIMENKLAKEWVSFFSDFESNSRTIITLNYDTILESIIYNYKVDGVKIGAKMSDYSDFYKLPLPNISNRLGGMFLDGGVINKEKIHIIKLHGSMNWFFSQKFQNSENAIFHMENYYLKENQDTYCIHLKGLKSFIIPPSLDKTSFYSENHFMHLTWTQARKALSKAKELVFFGYSFPPSDSYMTLLFKTALNQDIERICVIDNCIENTKNNISQKFKDKVEDLFKKNKVNFYNSLKDYMETQ